MQNDKADVKNSTRCHSKLIHSLSLSHVVNTSKCPSEKYHIHKYHPSHVKRRQQTTYTRIQVTPFPFHENGENTGFFAAPQTNKHDNYIWQTTTVLPPTGEVVIRCKRVASPVGCICGCCWESSRQETWTTDKITYCWKTILLGIFWFSFSFV